MKTSESIRNSAPMPEQLVAEMFAFIDRMLAPPDQAFRNGCDHTLRFAREFCRSHGLNEYRTIAWLEDHGGFCDCEVLMNVGVKWIPSSYDPEVDDSCR